MKNKLVYGIVFSVSLLAGFILFFAEKRYSKEYKNNNNTSL
ncbi:MULTISPECIES: hypothetical protein [Bacillaceae]|nr:MULTISPECIES: hypothetical protein [Bacillaceae]